jgi:hypothetical protein
MSVREQRIRNLAKRLGIKIESVKWTPIGGNLEMCGPEGGWLVFFEDSDVTYTNYSPIVAYHYKDVLQQLRAFEVRARRARRKKVA